LILIKTCLFSEGMAIDNASTLLLQTDVNVVVNLLGTYWETIVVTIVAAAGVIVSVVTYIFERKKFDLTREAEDKKFRLTALTEAFRLLNDVKHREARKVVYGNLKISSFEILGLVRPTSEEGAGYEE
jgi:hypothetical protein